MIIESIFNAFPSLVLLKEMCGYRMAHRIITIATLHYRMFALKALTVSNQILQTITHIKNKYCTDELVVLWF